MNSTKSSLKDALTTESAHVHNESVEAETASQHHAFHHKLKAHVHRHVHKLRQRPDHHKRAIAFSVAFTCTAIVFGIWYFFSLPRIISSYKINVEQSKRLNRSPNVIQGFNDIYNAKLNKANATESIEVGE